MGSSATIDTTSVFKGNVLALTAITVNTNAVIEGRVLAQNAAVTLDTNTITTANCTGPQLSITTPAAGHPTERSPGNWDR